ncbi:peptide chain release factor 1 [Methanosarcinales archaeon]|nr:MAG: peptide chain release factor 1 [Methanosarcinales archaeon]
MVDAHKKYEFKKQLEELREKHGRGTELISLYIPHDKQISDVTSQLRDEYGQASNIKSRLTRGNVQSAIDSLLSRLKYIQKAPENGFVIFTGAIDIGANKTDMQTTIIEPPEPLISYKYHCDSEFYLQTLEEMLEDKRIYGLLVLDRREANIGLLHGKRIEVLASLTSNVPGKQRKGGQSSHRFQQLRLIAINEFYTRIGDKANSVFLAVNHHDLEGIIIGGPSPTKEEFKQGEYLHHELQKKILGLVDTSYTDESGLYELLENAQDILEGLDIIKEKQYMQDFMKELVKDKGCATYGEEQVRKNLGMGAAQTLLLSENLKKVRVTMVCETCKHEEKKTYARKPGKQEIEAPPCSKCKSTTKITQIVDMVEELSVIADQMGTEVVFISADFEEGEQLLNAFGGIAAILRYHTGI